MTVKQLGNKVRVCFQGARLYGSILLWSWLVNLDIFLKVVAGFFKVVGLVGIGGVNLGVLIGRHLSGSLCITGFAAGSLLRHMAYLW